MTTPVLIVLLFVTAVVMAALGGWTHHNRRRTVTSHEDDDTIFRTAPRWAGRLNEKLNELKQQVGREARADERRDRETMSIATDTLDKARAADTVSKSTNIAVKEVIRLLKENQQNPGDTAALQEAMAILDGVMADDASVLTDGTPAEPA